MIQSDLRVPARRRLRGMMQVWNTPQGWLRVWRAFALVALLLCVGGLARAEPAATCSVEATAMNFGDYDPIEGQPATTTGNITIYCSKNKLDVTVELDGGTAASFQPRLMRSGSETLAYNVYADASHSQVLGNGNSGTVRAACSTGQNRPGCAAVNDPGRGSGAMLTLHGLVPASQNVAVGSYTDQLQVTIFF